MTLQIVGAGFGRTGTLSMKFALEQLGFKPCYHMMEVANNPGHRGLWQQAAGLAKDSEFDWPGLFAGYAATVDWPGAARWEAIFARWPDATVLLTVRDGASWHRSVMNTIWATSKAGLASSDPKIKAATQMVDALVWQGIFDGRIEDEAHAINVFEQHNQRVRKLVPAGQLLEVPVGSGWQPLCEHFDLPVPATDYPRVNDTGSFRERFGLE